MTADRRRHALNAIAAVWPDLGLDGPTIDALCGRRPRPHSPEVAARIRADSRARRARRDLRESRAARSAGSAPKDGRSPPWPVTSAWPNRPSG